MPKYDPVGRRIRWYGGIGVLVLSLALVGCGFLDNIIDAIGGVNPGGGGTPSTDLVIVNAEMSSRLSGTLVWKDGPDWTYADIGAFGTSLNPSAVVSWSDASHFSVSWNGPEPGTSGDAIVDSELTVELSADGSFVKRALLRYREEGPSGGYYSLLEVTNVPFDHEDGSGERHFMLWNQPAIDAVQDIEDVAWASPDTFASPTSQLKTPPLANIYTNGIHYTYIDVGIWEQPAPNP